MFISRSVTDDPVYFELLVVVDKVRRSVEIVRPVLR